MERTDAICECKDFSEDSKVVAIRDSRFAFVRDWGVITWVLFVVAALFITPFLIGGIIGWHWSDIFSPKYRCNHCNSEIPASQYR